MARQAPTVREAGPSDALQLLLLWSSVAPATETSEQACAEAEQALANLAADPDEKLLVAEDDDRVVGALYLQRGSASPLSLEPAVHTSYLIVLPESRRHGYGHALMEAACSWAEEKGVAQLTAFTDGGRENNRFLARLGLVTVGTVRLTSTAAMRKRFTAGRAGSRASARHSNRHLVEVLTARRHARRRQDAL